jgi:hypothetical protein
MNQSVGMRRKSYSAGTPRGTDCARSPIYPGPRLSRHSSTCPSLNP